MNFLKNNSASTHLVKFLKIYVLKQKFLHVKLRIILRKSFQQVVDNTNHHNRTLKIVRICLIIFTSYI